MTEEQVQGIVERLKRNPTTSAIVEGWSDERIATVARNYGEYRKVTREVPKSQRPDMETALQAMTASGTVRGAPPRAESCMVHVPFKRRYGAGKAVCLR